MGEKSVGENGKEASPGFIITGSARCMALKWTAEYQSLTAIPDGIDECGRPSADDARRCYDATRDVKAFPKRGSIRAGNGGQAANMCRSRRRLEKAAGSRLRVSISLRAGCPIDASAAPLQSASERLQLPGTRLFILPLRADRRRSRAASFRKPALGQGKEARGTRRNSRSPPRTYAPHFSRNAEHSG